MNALVRAELAKLCTRAHAAGLLVCMVFVPIAVASEIPKPGKGGAALSLDDPRLLALAVGTGFSFHFSSWPCWAGWPAPRSSATAP